MFKHVSQNHPIQAPLSHPFRLEVYIFKHAHQNLVQLLAG